MYINPVTPLEAPQMVIFFLPVCMYFQRVFPGCSVVKNPPAMQETQVQSLGREDCPEGRNGNPFQYSCLGNPMDRGAWQAI